MRFETFADLIEAYQAGEMSRDNPLIIDEDGGIAYVENLSDERDEHSEDDEEKYLFYSSLLQLTIDAIEYLGIDIESS